VSRIYQIEALADRPSDAAREFYQRHALALREAIEHAAEALTILLPDAPVAHDDWRRAMARDLARAHAPKRINAIGGGSPEARAAALAFVDKACGVTGQYFPLDQNGEGESRAKGDG